MMDHFHGLFITDYHFFLDLCTIHIVNKEYSGCCSMSHAILIYLKKASLKPEKEGGKHISSDLPSNLTISSLTTFANSTGRTKRSVLNNSALRVNWAWGELLHSQVCGLWFLLLTAHMDWKSCLCSQWFLSPLWILQFYLAFHPWTPTLCSCK